MLEVCQAIEEKQNFMLHIKNVTVVIGSRVEIDCKVLNFGWFGNETVNYTNIRKFLSRFVKNNEFVLDFLDRAVICRRKF